MAARTRCSPAVSRNPFLNESRPRSSCTCARLDHAAHQSSQRSRPPVTSSKSASSTPFETKRGSQCDMAEVTRASLATDASNEEPDAAEDSENRAGQDEERETAHPDAHRRALERGLVRHAFEEHFVGAGPRRGAILELGQ